MAFWSGEKLRRNQHVVTPFDPKFIDCNSYTMRMGSSYFRTADDETTIQTKQSLAPLQSFVVPPGQFGYLITKEEVSVPIGAMAFISMRTKYKYHGLINVSGFHVDPGYSGKLVFSVFNAGSLPVHIAENDKVFKIWFADLERESGPDYIYTKAGAVDIDNDLVAGMSKEILSLQSLADKMRKLESDVAARLAEQKPVIDNLNTIWRTVTLGVVAAIIISVLIAAGGAIWRAGELLTGALWRLLIP